MTLVMHTNLLSAAIFGLAVIVHRPKYYAEYVEFSWSSARFAEQSNLLSNIFHSTACIRLGPEHAVTTLG